VSGLNQAVELVEKQICQKRSVTEVRLKILESYLIEPAVTGLKKELAALFIILKKDTVRLREKYLYTNSKHLWLKGLLSSGWDGHIRLIELIIRHLNSMIKYYKHELRALANSNKEQRHFMGDNNDMMTSNELNSSDPKRSNIMVRERRRELPEEEEAGLVALRSCCCPRCRHEAKETIQTALKLLYCQVFLQKSTDCHPLSGQSRQLNSWPSLTRRREALPLPNGLVSFIAKLSSYQSDVNLKVRPFDRQSTDIL
jgi:hypothetical protein